MAHDSQSSRGIRQCNVNKAIEFIRKNNKKRNRQNTIKVVASESKDTFYCKYFQSDKKKKRISTVGFSKGLALSEMQSYVARQNWKHALNLLPKLLEYPIEMEPLVWRYVLIILLHTNDSSHIRQFFQQCIGSQKLNNSTLLKRLLLLPLKE